MNMTIFGGRFVKMQILGPLSSIPDCRSGGVAESAFLTGELGFSGILSSTSWGKRKSWGCGR